MLLYIVVRSTIAFLGRCLSILPTINSNPGVLWEFVLRSSWWTSLGEKNLTGKDNWQGMSRKFGISAQSMLSFVGEKTFARCSVKIFTFSWSVLAQVLIYGVATIGLLNFFVAFHSEWSSGDKFII
jgi:hypothetical protein